jgi:hypothetical protein
MLDIIWRGCRPCTEYALSGKGRNLLSPPLASFLASTFRLVPKQNFLFERKQPVCHVDSKAFSISKNTAVVDIFFKLRVAWSDSLMHCNDVQWHERNPNLLAFISHLPSMYLWTIFTVTFSLSHFVDRRLTGRKFWGYFGSLPGFG